MHTLPIAYSLIVLYTFLSLPTKLLGQVSKEHQPVSRQWRLSQRQHQKDTSKVSAGIRRSEASQAGQCVTTVGGPWTELGPSPFLGVNPEPEGGFETMSGQVSAIAVDLGHDPSGNLVYVGSSSGGLWKSSNGLSNSPRFIPLSDQTQSLSVGSIALDMRTNPPVIYVGTGAPDVPSNISSYTGTGILISADGGQTWRRVESADNGAHPFIGQGFSSILIDPVNPNVFLASTGIGTDYNFPPYSIPQGNGAFQNLGIYRSTDAGNTWSQVMSTNYGLSPPQGFFHTELLYEPSQGTYFAGVSRTGLFASTDRGATWRSFQTLGLGQGLPAADQMKRISLSTRDGVLWALLMRPAMPPATITDFFELYQSNDQGRSWRKLSPLHPEFTTKGFLMYVASPPNSTVLLVAAESIFRTVNIGATNLSWEKIEHNLHGDQHVIAFASARSWYVGDDGGAWATNHRGDAWTSLNDDLRTLEFFSADAGSGGSGAFAGGMQDNGSALTAGSPSWSQAVGAGGDGAYLAHDPQDPDAFFMSSQFGNILYVPISNPGNFKTIIQFSGQSPGLGLLPDFLSPYEIVPTDSRLYSGVTAFPGFNFARSRILLAGANNPWLVAFDPDAPNNNTAAMPLTNAVNNVIDFVAPVPGDPTAAYLVAGSALYRVSNISFSGNATVTQITGGPVNNVDILGHLAVSPIRPATLYLIKIGYLDGQKIFKSEDAGGTWINISGNLPNIPFNWITVDPANPDFVFLAGNTGAFVATDGGVQDEQWQKLGSGLPNVPVTQLRILPGRKLLAATYGRNVWTLDISHLFHEPALQYAVKFMCGRTDGDVVAPGTYFTAVDVHNPQEVPIAFRKKFAVALPGEKPGPISKFFTAKLCPDESFAINCRDIFARAQAAGAFLDGFAVLESDTELDVVATYTAAGATGQVETLELERVSPRRIVPASRPDLVPVSNCRKVNGRLVVTVKNVGVIASAASTTSTQFTGDGRLSQATPPVSAGGSVDLSFDLPSNCTTGCRFTITADSDNQIDESDESNNILEGVCIG